jgi:hypothetical protein
MAERNQPRAPADDAIQSTNADPRPEDVDLLGTSVTGEVVRGPDDPLASAPQRAPGGHDGMTTDPGAALRHEPTPTELGDPFGVGDRLADATTRDSLADTLGRIGGDQDVELAGDVDLDAATDLHLDPGYDLDRLAGGGSLDGRTDDASDGISRGEADGPADGTRFVSDGGTNAKDLTTGKTGVKDGLLNLIGLGKEAAATDAAAAIEAKNAPKEATAWEMRVRTFQAAEEALGGTGDLSAPGMTSTYAEQAKKAGAEQGIQVGVHQGGASGTTKDDLPPDHPDAGGDDHLRPPGSQTTDAIDQSIVQSLGGQRGGDVDPTRDGDDYVHDAEPVEYMNMISDPGDDHLMGPRVELDESALPDAGDLIAPELDDGGM